MAVGEIFLYFCRNVACQIDHGCYATNLTMRQVQQYLISNRASYMDWLVTLKPSYSTDFIELPKDLQKRATQAQVELEQNPITPRGDTVKQLKGWENLWRYRIGDYRLIYSVAPEQHVVCLLAIGPRGDIYRRFHYEPDSDSVHQRTFRPDSLQQLTPQSQQPPDWVNHPEWFQQRRVETNPLPRHLTPALLTQWLIPQEYHGLLMRCRSEEELLDADLPDTILGRVFDALWPPTVEQLATQPNQLLFNPADLEEFAAGNLPGFLLHLDETQRVFVDWSLSGPTLLKGAPGSGKSTVALYRIRAILEQAQSNHELLPTVLFTTYTNALVRFSTVLLGQLVSDLFPDLPKGDLPTNLRVSTIDKLAYAIVQRHYPTLKLAKDDQIWATMQQLFSQALPSLKAEPTKAALASVLSDLGEEFLLDEFEAVIEAQNCQTLEEYQAANRNGRGTPLRAPLRALVWHLYQQFRQQLQAQSLCTWGALRQLALASVRGGMFPQRWDYVLVDEAQDLTATALALAVELCRSPAGLFLTADANQSLYQRGFRWQNIHSQLKVAGRTRILRRNYRNTREIAEAAADLLSDLPEADQETDSKQFVNSGQYPVIYAAKGASDQAHWLAYHLAQATRQLRLPISAAAVLVPSQTLGQSLAQQLADQGMPARFMRSAEVDLNERCVKVLTLHAAKGLEFPVVAVAHVEADRLPREVPGSNDFELQEHLAQQRRLLYVGCTRAMRWLFLTHEQALPSQFLQLLSDERWLRFSTPS